MSVQDTVLNAIHNHRLLTPGQTVVVAVSGGADSLCLLHVLWSLRQALGLRLHVAHLDHQLRGAESAADARYVCELATGLGLPVTVEAQDVSGYRRQHNLTLEEAAREVRYSFLARVATQAAAAAVATGHTSDDNVETIVLHWLRGAGLAGMRGMAPLRPLAGFSYQRDQPTPSPKQTLLLVRPLLGVTRAQTAAYCLQHGLAFRTDSSNASESLLRNRIRLRLLPELERYNPRLRSTLLRAAAAAADDYAYLEAQVLLAWPSVATESGPGSALTLDRTAFHDLHPALQRGILRKALEGVWGGWQDFGWTHLESARLALLKGRVGTVVDLPHGLSLTVGYHAATLAAGPLPLESDLPTLSVDSLPLTVPGVTPLPGGPWRLEILPADIPAPLSAQPAAPRTALVDADAVGASLLLRRPRPGDRYQPLGMAGTKKLQDLLVDAKVPRQLRAGLPVLASQRGIVWVAGRWLADWARVSAATRQAWRVRFIRED